jgi:hypothetical protein
MRTTVELVDQLLCASEGVEAAALIVSFENSTVFLWAHDKDILNTLNEAIRTGGEPVGIVRYKRDGTRLNVQAGPLEEYAEDEHIRAYIGNLMEGFVRMFDETVSQ